MRKKSVLLFISATVTHMIVVFGTLTLSGFVMPSARFRNAISLRLVVGTYRWNHSSVQWKNILESSPRTFLSQHTFITLTMKSRHNATYFLRQDKLFSILPKHWQVSKYTAMLSEFSFPKKEKELSLNFGW